MEGCSSMSPWTNLYEQGGIDTIHEIITWDEGTPNNNNDHHQNLLPMLSPPIGCNMIQSQPLDSSKIYDATTSSIDQSLECLLSGTNSNTETSSDEDDGISILFSSNNNNNNNNNCPQKFWNFTSPVHRTGIATSNNNPRKRSQNSQETPQKHMKKQRSNKTSSKNISLQVQSKASTIEDDQDQDREQETIKEMIYRAAALRPVCFGVDPIERPKRKNVRISNDPQTAAARQRRERISERLRLLQKLVPGGSKLDTASMLHEAANYLKFLRNQLHDLETNNKVHHHQFHLIASTNNPFFTTPPNLQFSPTMPFPMQGNSPPFLPPNPSFTHEA